MTLLLVNNNTKRRIWLTEEQRFNAVDRYLKGETPLMIAETLGVCANNIRNALRRHGVTLRTRSEAHTVYNHWREAFDLLTEESSYWIGFLFSDGWIYHGEKGAPVIGVSVAERDAEHLIKFKTFLRTDVPLFERRHRIREKSHPAKSIQIRSEYLVAALRRYGMNTKSLGRVAPPELCNSRDFWRGVVDGDGYVGIPERGPRLGVCGGEALMRQFLSFAQAHGIGLRSRVQFRSTTKRPPLCIVGFTKGSAFNAIKLLYENADIALDRKIQNAQEHLKKKQAAPAVVCERGS